MPLSSLYCVRLPLLATVLLLVACNESTPKIINTGASRPFSFETYFVSPLNETVIATNVDTSSQNIAPASVQEQALATDSNNSIFSNINNCQTLTNLHRRGTPWSWIEQPATELSFDNNHAVFLTEKAYFRFFTNYCVAYNNFYNANVVENTSTSNGSKFYYLQSNKLNITDAAQTSIYKFLLSQKTTNDQLTNLLFVLAQESAQDDYKFYERMNYTKTASSRGFRSIRVLVSSDFVKGKLPSSYQVESYALDRRYDTETKQNYDLIRMRYSKLFTPKTSIIASQILLYADVIVHPVYGSRVFNSRSCYKKEVSSFENDLEYSCPPTSIEGKYYTANSAKTQWYSSQGLNINFNENYKEKLTALSSDLEQTHGRNSLVLQWIDFSTFDPEVYFQTDKPERILPSAY